MKKKILVLLCAAVLCSCSSKDKNTDDSGRASYGCRTIDYFDYTGVIPETSAVDEYWFSDALFLGDIRVSSLLNYSSLEEEGADVHYIPGLELDTFETAYAETYDGNASLSEILMNTDKQNVFLMIGLNDAAQSDFTVWRRKVKQLITDFQKKHSRASLYLILPYHVAELDGVPADELQERIDEIRDVMMSLGSELKVYCLDSGKAVEGDDGIVDENYVWDGIRLNQDGTDALMDYISRHVVREELYVRKVCS